MEIVERDSAPLAEICCPIELDISRQRRQHQQQLIQQDQEPEDRQHCQKQPQECQHLHVASASNKQLLRQEQNIDPSSLSNASVSSSPRKKESTSSSTEILPLPPSSPLSPVPIAPKMNNLQSTVPLYPHNASYGDNHTLINALKCKIFTLKQHIEELQSSEALIIGEQKMRIRKLEASEPLRVKELTEELRSLKRSFVDLLEGQIEELAKMQIDINDVRVMASDIRTCNGRDSSSGLVQDVKWSSFLKPKPVTDKMHSCNEILSCGSERRDDVPMEETNAHGNQNSTVGDHSEVIDYESEIRDAQKNVFILQKVLERRTAALRHEVDRLSGRSKAAKCPKKVKSSTESYLIDKADRKHAVKVTPIDVSVGIFHEQRNPPSISHTDGLFDARVRFIDHNGVRHTLPVDEVHSDDDESEKPSTSKEIQKIQKELVDLKVSKESEIGELRCLIAMQNMHYASRIIASHVKIDEINTKQEYVEGATIMRLDELERETKRLKETISMSGSSESDDTLEIMRCPGKTDLFQESRRDGTIQHANNSLRITIAAPSTDQTEAKSTCQAKNEGNESTDSANSSIAKESIQSDQIESGHIIQRDIQRPDIVEGLKALLDEKESHISHLENELSKANDAIKVVATALNTLENRNDSPSSAESTQNGIEEVKSSWWLKVNVLKKKRKRSRRKGA